MNNLILTLLCINKIGRKTVNNFINNIEELPKDEIDVIDIFEELKSNNKKIKVPTIEEIKIAQNESFNIIENSKKLNINSVDFLQKEFPNKLKVINDPPPILFYKGNYDAILNPKSIAIVGSRHAGEKGLSFAYESSKYFGKENFTVVSGLAIGCDEKAHKGCLDGKGQTVAVLSGGLDYIYPVHNRELGEEILNNKGCLLSEYPIGYSSFKNNFIERDRIQSGLSNGVLVVEAGLDSGTMYTARYSIEQNKVLACFDIDAKGNRLLLKENNALLVNHNNLDLLKEKIITHEISLEDEHINQTKQIKFKLK